LRQAIFSTGVIGNLVVKAFLEVVNFSRHLSFNLPV
jgi:hypothetical protein